jgi:hypothetical protein
MATKVKKVADMDSLKMIFERENGDCMDVKIKKFCDFKKVFDFLKEAKKNETITLSMIAHDMEDLFLDYVELSGEEIKAMFESKKTK